ncbi:hypothetical protein [Kineococcus aurantiacus]|uniref:Uncharacterized protein n=1 Tax=Kineococcus aurantiacus TaxID=37633 RepID=A0A7Y9DPT7_9ACTN|nr:hypothetical protein [Kineococcus aurantiacus]NYD24478.1 hypothetical protein [Kineococcus aurantiacus]
MNPTLNRTLSTAPTTAPESVPESAPAPAVDLGRTPVPTARGAQHRAPGRPLTARRAPRPVELGDAGSGAVLASVLEGLRALPDRPAVDHRTRVREALRTAGERLDVPVLLLVVRAGVLASLALTVLLALWLADSGRLG